MASGSTSNYSIPYPVPTDPVDVAGDIEALAGRIDNILQEEIEDASAAMWTGGTFTNGLTTPTYNDSTGKMSMGIVQDISASASPTFANIDLTGSISSGSWNADTISVEKGGTGLTSFDTGDIIYASSSATIAKLNIGSSGQVLETNGSSPLWVSTSGTGNIVRVDSPSLTGIPTSPTAASGTSTTQIATTEFVMTEVSSVAGALPSQSGQAGKFLTTDGSVAAWEGIDQSDVINLTTDLAAKAPIDNPEFTGTVSTQGTLIRLNSDATGGTTDDVYITVERGSDDVSIRWNEATNRWELTNNGTNYEDISSLGLVGSMLLGGM